MNACRGDFICENKIAALLGKAYKVQVVDRAVSTNSELWSAAINGAPEGTVLIARQQTGGKGRLGRSFCSAEGGLYMSLLLRPELCPEDTALITPLAALAVAETVDRLLGINTAIKWVNDVYADGKKLCGILTEASIDPLLAKTSFVIVGIGLNVYAPDGGFPEEIRDIATALLPHGARKEGLFNQLAADIARRVFEYAENPFNGKALEDYRSKCFVIGKDVTVYRGGDCYNARVLGVDDRYALLIEDEGGNRIALNSGEVSVRLKGGGR